MIAPADTPNDRGSSTGASTGQCHVWFVSLTVDDSKENELLSVLSSDERRRMDRRPLRTAARQSALAWASLRIALSQYTGSAPKTVQILRDRSGRPHVVHPAGLSVSLAHSGDVAALAVTEAGRVGVDVERLRPLDDRALARRFYASSEADALAVLPPEERRRAFFRLWVRKEAVAKAAGVGVPAALRHTVSSSGAAEHPDPLIDKGAAADWTLCDVRAPVGYAAAVALDRCDVRICLHEA